VSVVKREMERQDGLVAVATSIAIEIGALERCEHCEEVTDPLAGMEEEVTEEALTRFRSGADEMADFRSEDEVRQAVQSAITDTGEECSCARHRDD
jgi:hypothetical protein